MSKIITAVKNTEAKQNREFYLDWIRNAVVLILVPFHTAVSFSHIGKGYVYTATPENSWFYIFISDFFNLWIMRLLFFVSGISVYMSFKKRSAALFIKDRFKRLVMPVLFLLVTLGPLAGYILAIGRDHYTDSFFHFYPLFFIQAREYLFWGHMWYCVYLFNFSIILLPFFSFLLKRPRHIQRINKVLMRGNRILLPMGVIILFEALLRPLYPGYQSFIGDWANVAVYSSFFILGFIMGQSTELFDLISRKTKLFLILATVSTILYLLCKRVFLTQESYFSLVVQSILWGAAAYSWVFSFIGLFKKNSNSDSRLLKYLSATSFSLYLFHYLILSVLNYFLLKTGLPHFSIWMITTLGTYLIFFILFELLLKRIRLLCYICGIRYGNHKKRRPEGKLDRRDQQKFLRHGYPS